jgi:hypothetical protein
MTPTQRNRWLAIQSRLDQLLADADDIQAEPVTAEPNAMAEDLREILAAMLARLEERLEGVQISSQSSGRQSLFQSRSLPP